MSINNQTNNRHGNNRPDYGQDTQQFGNRSESRDSVRNYNNDLMRGRSGDRNNDRPVQTSQRTLSHGRS